MKKLMLFVCVTILVAVLSAPQVLARGHFNTGDFLSGLGEALQNLGEIMEQEAANQQQQQQYQFVPGIPAAIVKCNQCGFVEAWQGWDPIPPHPSCGCVGSYIWEWKQ